MRKSTVAELIRAREVRKTLSTKILKVEDFASLHDDIVDLVTPLLQDGVMSAVTTKYIDAVEQLNTLKTSLTHATTDTSTAAKTLKELKREITVFANVVKKARHSQSANIQPIAKTIYDEYVVALNGNRLNVINAKDIIKVFVAKLSKMNKTAIKTAGFEDYVTYISAHFARYTFERNKAIRSQEKRAKIYKAMIKQRDIVEGAYQMMAMMLNGMEYSTGDKSYTTVLNAVMLRVNEVKATQKGVTTKAENRKAAQLKTDEKLAVEGDEKKLPPRETEKNPTELQIGDKQPDLEHDNDDETPLVKTDETPTAPQQLNNTLLSKKIHSNRLKKKMLQRATKSQRRHKK